MPQKLKWHSLQKLFRFYQRDRCPISVLGDHIITIIAWTTFFAIYSNKLTKLLLCKTSNILRSVSYPYTAEWRDIFEQEQCHQFPSITLEILFQKAREAIVGQCILMIGHLLVGSPVSWTPLPATTSTKSHCLCALWCNRGMMWPVRAEGSQPMSPAPSMLVSASSTLLFPKPAQKISQKAEPVGHLLWPIIN